MALPSNLTTNEIKNSAGTEVQFLFHSRGPGRSVIFAQDGESPALEHRLLVSHQETGSGIKQIRRSVARIDKTVMSTVDTTLPVVCSFYQVAVIPVGALLALTEPTHVCAELMSFVASLGASTTILYDGTGYGAAALINGTL
jgi:hypothetical protein